MWVKQNGGDNNFVEFLSDHGFASKLSLKYLNLESEDGQSMLSQFSLGQRCLLIGLIKLCAEEEVIEPSCSLTASTSASQAYSIASKGRGKSQSNQKSINFLISIMLELSLLDQSDLEFEVIHLTVIQRLIFCQHRPSHTRVEIITVVKVKESKVEKPLAKGL